MDALVELEVFGLVGREKMLTSCHLEAVLVRRSTDIKIALGSTVC